MSQYRIKNIIKKNGIKKGILADKLNISRPTLDAWIIKDAEEHYLKVMKVLDYEVTEEFSIEEFNKLKQTVADQQENINHLLKENRKLTKKLEEAERKSSKKVVIK